MDGGAEPAPSGFSAAPPSLRLTGLRYTILPGGSGMGLKEEYDFDILVNEAENLVIKELEGQIAQTPGACTCQDCILDMAAYALNKVKPNYRVSLLGKLYSQAMDQGEYTREIKAAVQEAIRKVQGNRSHD
jgi:competence protein ComFB